MAGGGSGATGSVKVEGGGGNNNYGFAFSIMVSLFFMIGFITVLNDVLIPSLKEVFELKAWQAMLIQFCFFTAYLVMSIPAGKLIEKVGYKKGLAIALGVMGTGLLLFIPASMTLMYGFFLFALFVVASGITILQVAINPYIIALGPEETGASRLNLGGALNSTATFVGPILGGAFILKEFHLSDFPSLADMNMAKAEAVQGPYLILALVTIAIAGILFMTRLPKLSSEKAIGEEVEGSAWDYKHLIYGSGAIFFYVGAEVAIGSLLVLYLAQDEMGNIPEKLASSLLAYYWGSAMIGRFIGSAVGQKIKANVLLSIVSVIALGLIILSMLGFTLTTWVSVPVMNILPETGGIMDFSPVKVPLSAVLLVLVGLFNSVMWPAIFPLGIAKLKKHTSQGSGIMVMMVFGGAVIPLLQGFVADAIGYRFSFIICLFCYAYILWFALKGYKAGKISTMIDSEEE